MKYKILLLIILFPVFAQAQKDVNLDTLVNNLVSDLKESWTLGVDSNSNVVDIRTFNKFKGLFDSSATVVDDFNAFYRYDPTTNTGTYAIDSTQKSFDVYAHDLALQVSKLRIDAISTSIKNNGPGNVTIEIRRALYAEKEKMFVLSDSIALAEQIINQRIKKINFQNKGDSIAMASNLKEKISEKPGDIYQFTDTSTLFITAVFNKNENEFKIKSISVHSNKLTCINDADNDAVLDSEDSAKNCYGDFTAHGMPDDDLDGIPYYKDDHTDKCRYTYGTANNQGCPASYYSYKKQFDAFLGMQLSAVNINLPELNKLGYKDESGNDAMRVLESKKGVLKNPGWIPGFYGGANIAYFFGKKSKKGISVGFTYLQFKANYELTEPMVYTFKASDGIDFYRRQLTIKKLTEEIDYNVITVPLMLNYKTHLARFVMCIKAGPALVLFNNRSDYNATVDIGGIYQVDPNQNKITYDPYFDPTSTYNVYITSAGIDQQNTNPGAANVFSQLSSKTYDFVNDKIYQAKKKLFRAAVGFNAVLETQNNINKQLAIKAGVHYNYTPLFERKEKYKPLDQSTEEFQSIYNSNAKRNYTTFGVMVGVVYSF